MHSIPQLQQLVEENIKNSLSYSNAHGLYEPITYILGIGGKRMRPVLCLVAAEMFGMDVQKALHPAVGIEVFHNFTLIHDDIMDQAPLRRGNPTVHTKWDINKAILSGDAMMIQAYSLIAMSEHEVLPAVLKLFNETALQVCEGQQLDMEFENRKDVSISQYIEMIRLKTSVLLAGSLKLGAILAKADEKDANHLYNFGINAGIAFQLQDDLLDAFGDAEKFGKQVGGDILSNKKTFLLLKSVEKADAETAARLAKYFFNNHLESNDQKVKDVLAIYNSLNIRVETEKEIDLYFNKAMDSLKKVSTSEESKRNLYAFAESLMVREF